MASSNSTGTIFKILLLGDSAVGKTCFLTQFSEGTFKENHLATIGLDFRLKDTTLPDGTNVILKIWDTAGQEKFRTITKNYFKGADGIILLYDISKKDTFEGITIWLEDIANNGSERVKVILVGNKTDLKEGREVSFDEGKKLADTKGLSFFESSAKKDLNIQDCVHELVSQIIQVKKKQQVQNNEFNSTQLNQIKKEGNCCSK